jgi:Primase C terminal 2 (PriCT-2)
MPKNTPRRRRGASAPALQPDAEQLGRFVTTVFKYATTGLVSLRAFAHKDEKKADTTDIEKVKTNSSLLFDRRFEVDDLGALIHGATVAARHAANGNRPAVFAPPLTAFHDYARTASESNVAEAYVISVECDAHPRAALTKLTAVLGAPTLVVESGGRWLNPETNQPEPKLHLHWRLAVPASDLESLSKLKEARSLACRIVGADASNVPLVHPIRWAGSWHVKDKNEPRLCRIIEETDVDIDLDDALAKLRAVVPEQMQQEAKRDRRINTASPDDDGAGELSIYEAAFLPPIEKVRSALFAIPNTGPKDWNWWKIMMMRLYVATGGSDAGFALSDEWSKQNEDAYNEADTRAAWLEIRRSPPAEIYPETLFKVAREDHGWVWKPTPSGRSDKGATKKSSVGIPADEARSLFRSNMNRFLDRVVIAKERPEPGSITAFVLGSLEMQLEDGKTAPRVVASQVTTGIGKTTITIDELAKRLHDGRIKRVFYAVPHHDLTDHVVKLFRNRGINARAFRGREADDPDNEGHQMCLDQKKMKVAVEAGAQVYQSCCKYKDEQCEFFDGDGRCGYIEQLEGASEDPPQVWVFASNLLFHSTLALGTADVLIVDEKFWDRGLDGIERNVEVPLEKLILKPYSDDETWRRRDELRCKLKRALQRQEVDGGVTRQTLLSGTFPLDAADFDEAIKLEQACVNQVQANLGLRPGVEFSSILLSLIGRHIKIGLRMVKIWEEARAIARPGGVTVSGRLTLGEDEDGQRVVRWRGRREITTQFRCPTFIIDATPPIPVIYRKFYPQCEVLEPIIARMPASVRIVQHLHAPTSKSKLVPQKGKQPSSSQRKHLAAIERFILQRWYESGRQPMGVIAQEGVEDMLKELGLPDSVLPLFIQVFPQTSSRQRPDRSGCGGSSKRWTGWVIARAAISSSNGTRPRATPTGLPRLPPRW